MIRAISFFLTDEANNILENVIYYQLLHDPTSISFMYFLLCNMVSTPLTEKTLLWHGSYYLGFGGKDLHYTLQKC